MGSPKKTSAKSAAEANEIYQSKNRIRMVTAASLFDGHDAAINVMRRILQASGAEIIHLGHNRSVHEIATAAIQEDVQAVAISSYQGGHNEFFRYLFDELKRKGAGHIRIFGGGGGVIIPEEIAALQKYGIARIFSPDDGRALGLQGMINEILRLSDFPVVDSKYAVDETKIGSDQVALAHAITAVEQGQRVQLKEGSAAPVLGITGTGGAGKSSLVDEFLLRYQRDFPKHRIAVLSVDPSKRKTGGALLGDRIRMNSVYGEHVFVRSLATRGSASELGDSIRDVISVVQAAGYDLIVLESSGIGQADTGIVDVCDVPIYVMTSEFGAPTQLEKIDMLDFAKAVVINKADRKGSQDALREVRRQLRRVRNEHDAELESFPVFLTMASRFSDPGVTAFYRHILQQLKRQPESIVTTFPRPTGLDQAMIPDRRIRYLSEVADGVRSYHQETRALVESANLVQSLREAAAVVPSVRDSLLQEATKREAALPSELRKQLSNWDATAQYYRQEESQVEVHGKTVKVPLARHSLSGLRIPRIAFPRTDRLGEQVRFLRSENVPGTFPYAGGVFPLKRDDEEPRRQFAGEGGPERTNKRFHYLSRNDKAKRLSTAFDSVTLYGMDPDERPDIFGKIGESGVSICSLDDMKILYRGFDLVDPSTSVSMTINGPAPMLLAMFFNTAIDQVVDKKERETGKPVTPEERVQIRKETLQKVRGTVQADILKEDQAQNTCIFSTEFALRAMGDIQEYFTQNGVRHYYSVSISGYHIAEAGANPISQLAFTLANGFTYVEYYLSRGLKIDDFAHNLSFFFSNGLDPEYSVMGRVARRIWAIAMRDRYGANPRSQKLKYHIQTSGRSLHAQEIDFNDIRTTLQALVAVYDHCNSLHTNAYDEAITTPTEESVRRAMAIQMIINREFGMTKCENPLQGAYIVDELTDLVEEAVLAEFDRISQRGGVLGAMEVQYQRSKIQEESLTYERLKHSGELPIIGVNTFQATHSEEAPATTLELARATDAEKTARIADLRKFQKAHAGSAKEALERLQHVAVSGENLFAELMETVRVASLGQITQALFEVGGQFRRSM